MKYQNYHFQDFMLDEGFQNWVLKPDPNADIFWPNWVLLHPEKEEEINKARNAILALTLASIRKERVVRQQARDLEPAPGDQQALWQQIAQAMASADTAANALAAPAARVIPLWRRSWVRAAAAVLLVLGWLFWLRPHQAARQQVAYQTTFGQTRRIPLPDGSEVFLNANSRLTFARSWAAGADRQVSLAGEAFFAVKPEKSLRKFKVHLSGAQVEVLGTEFTVTNRPSLTRVVLNHGKVKVGLAGVRQDLGAAAILVPGDLVEIDRRENRLKKSRVARPENYSAFVQHVIEFNDSPLAEVARVLQDNYGYKVTFLPAALADKRFTSSNPDNRIDLLLFAIEKSFNLQVSRKGKHITIRDTGN